MESALGELAGLWPYAAAGATFLLSVLTSGHVILYKRDSRSAVGWVGVIWLAPVVGALLYALLGVNRIQRRAAGRRPRTGTTTTFERHAAPGAPPALPEHAAHLASLAELVQRLSLGRSPPATRSRRW
ncbi:MAG: PLD nuclease N-terminal domain-containing protein [Gemmatimonadales bacterium]